MNKNASTLRKWLVLCGFVVCITSIAASQFPEQSYDIYGMDVMTGRIFQISYGPLTGEYNPSWSQDGKFIVHDITPPSPAEQYLGVTNVKTGETTMLVGGAGGNNAAWSPNGQWIAFDLCPGFAHGCAEANIYVVPARGGERRFVTDNGVSPSWSANSKMVAFETPGGGSVYTIDISGANKKQILPGPDKYLWSPKWSPDGQWIFCGAWGYGPEDHWGGLFKIRVDNNGNAIGEPQYVTWFFGGLTLSNDSKSIVQDYYGQIWSFSVARDQWTQLTTGLNWGDYDPAYSSNGQYIAFARSLAPLPKPGVAQQALVPAEFELSQNYPNPFNPTTTIRYQLPVVSHVRLAVYDMLGREVSILVDRAEEAGYKSVEFDASDLSSDVYIYKLQAGDFVQMKKLILVK